MNKYIRLQYKHKSKLNPLENKFQAVNKLRLGALILLSVCLIYLIYLGSQEAFPILEDWIGKNEQVYSRWLTSHYIEENVWILFPIAYLGGIIASLSPCILALLPLSLSYIGTLNIHSKREAFFNAIGFVLGVVAVLGILGLSSSAAGALTVDYKGYINIGIGVFSILMGFTMLGIVRFPIPSLVKRIPSGTSPFFIGIAFSLVGSPCASPVLLTMLSLAAGTGRPEIGITIMTLYGIGYTTVIFLASLLTGFTKRMNSLKQHSHLIERIGSTLLILIGSYLVLSGLSWFKA